MKNTTSFIKKFFLFEQRSATFKKEIIGGISTFLAMAYILAVNPGMLGGAWDGGFTAEGAPTFAGASYTGVFFIGTALSAMIGTMAMAFVGKIPVALAPGMGLNAFLAYTVSSVGGIPIEGALLITMVSGWLYMFLALSPLREKITKFLPRNIKLAIGAMIGLFLAYVGLINSGIIITGASQENFGFGDIVVVGTPTMMGDISKPWVIIALLVLILVIVFHYMKVPGGIMIAIALGIFMMAIAKWSGVSEFDDSFTKQEYTDFNGFGELSGKVWKSFGDTFSNPTAYIALFVFVYIDFFDTTGTIFAVTEQLELDESNNESLLKRVNAVDAGSTIAGSMVLTSTTTSYIESSVGIAAGARTGFASVITALLFGLSIAAWPIMSPILPVAIEGGNGIGNAVSGYSVQPVVGPVLVLVGSLMIAQLKSFEWGKTIDIPVLVIILVFGAFTYSISDGIAAGIVIYFILNACAWAVTVYKAKKGITWSPNSEDMKMTGDVKEPEEHGVKFKDRVINPIIIPLFVLSVAFFVSMPWW